MRSCRSLALLFCLLAAGLPGNARADEAALSQCLGTIDDIDIDFLMADRADDSCTERRAEIDALEALVRDLRALRGGVCRPSLIAGGSYSASEIEDMLRIQEADADDLTVEIEELRAEFSPFCGTADRPRAR